MSLPSNPQSPRPSRVSRAAGIPDAARGVLDFLSGIAQQGKEMPEGTLPGYENENLRYYNAQALSRPLDMPGKVKRGLAVALAAGAVIGAVLLYGYFDGLMSAPQREQAALEENLARDVSLDLPQLASLVPLSDGDAMAAVSESGATLYEKVPVGSLKSGGFEVIKLPEGVTVEEAGAMYVAGLNNLSASGAARLLNGSWDLIVNRKDSTSFQVKYVDFKSGNTEEAIRAAMEAEGLASDSIADSGVDDAGNTYAAGTVTAGDATYNWRVSAIPFSEAFEIEGLPTTASYVGIRFSAA